MEYGRIVKLYRSLDSETISRYTEQSIYLANDHMVKLRGGAGYLLKMCDTGARGNICG